VRSGWAGALSLFFDKYLLIQTAIEWMDGLYSNSYEERMYLKKWCGHLLAAVGGGGGGREQGRQSWSPVSTFESLTLTNLLVPLLLSHHHHQIIFSRALTHSCTLQ
jgi:hypothetical protein